DLRTFFRDRGLSSDTTMFVNVALDVALTEISSKRLVPPGFIRRVAIIGPGLDFTDKSEGYDFYPVQTIQPFAIIDSLVRLGLSDLGGLQVSTFDLSPRINAHLERARERALRGESYELALPLDTTRKWTEGLLSYWSRFGERIGRRSNAIEVVPGV